MTACIQISPSLNLLNASCIETESIKTRNWILTQSIKPLPRNGGRKKGSKNKTKGRPRKSGGGRPKMPPSQKIKNMLDKHFNGSFANYKSVKDCASAAQAAKKIGFNVNGFYILNRLFKANPDILNVYTLDAHQL